MSVQNMDALLATWRAEIAIALEETEVELGELSKQHEEALREVAIASIRRGKFTELRSRLARSGTALASVLGDRIDDAIQDERPDSFPRLTKARLDVAENRAQDLRLALVQIDAALKPPAEVIQLLPATTKPEARNEEDPFKDLYPLGGVW